MDETVEDRDRLNVLFSVIIPTFNRLEFLRATLESVWSQSCTDYEVIVVDDGSTDGTAEYLESLGKRIILIRQDHQGPGAARNAGGTAAQGQYLALLDSDDLWFPWSLETFGVLIERHHLPAVICGKFIEFKDVRELATCSSEPVKAEYFVSYFASWRHDYIIGSGMVVIRRAEFLNAGGFMTGQINLEDHDLMLRLGNAAGFVQVLAPTTLGWRRHASGATRNAAKSAAGSIHLVTMERAGAFPGGSSLSQTRRHIITKHTRPVSLECMRTGLIHAGWELYRKTMWWHLRLRRWKYLLGFPVFAVMAALRGTSARAPLSLGIQ